MKQVIILALFFSLTIIHAQNTYKGILIDGNGIPIFAANVIQLTLPDSTMVKGAISDDRGIFELPDNAQGKPFVIKITHLEYKEKILKPMQVDLGTITLQKSINELGEVVVSAKKPFMRQKGTLITTDIASSVLKNLPQVTMIIDFLPGVSKTNLGDLEVFGKKNPVIYVNNRKLRSNVELLQLSPQEIESISIETQPGSEYDNSVGAIIRIKLKKKLGDGLGGIVALESHFHNKGMQLHSAISLNYRTGKTDFFLMTQPEYRNKLWNENNEELTVKTQSKQWRVNSQNTQKDNSKRLFSKFGFNHEFSEEHSIGASATIHINPMSGHIFVDQENETYQNNNLMSKNEDHYDRFNQNKSLVTNLYYEGKIYDKLKLQTDLDYQGMYSDNTSDIAEKNLLMSTQRTVHTHSEAQSNWWGLKTTFTQKIGKGELSYGFEGSKLLRNEAYIDNVLSTSKVENKELKSALFTSYAFPWKKINFKSGLRYEYTDFEYFKNRQKHELQSRSYCNLLPNVSVSFPWGKTQWSLSYIKRIRRPAFYELSNYSAYSSSFLYNKGNPDLVPTLTDEFSWLTTYKNYSLSTEYSIVRDGIFTDYQLYTLNPNVVEKTLRNFDTYKTLKFVLSAQHKIGKIWRPKTTFTFIKQLGEGVFENNKPALNIDINNQLVFSEKWTGLLRLHYYSKGVFQGNTYNDTNTGIVDFILIGTFPKHNLQLYTGITDIFNSNIDNTVTKTPYISNRSYTNNPNSRMFTITLAYRFNPANNKYKGRESNEEKNRL
jgi:hypothetical protein